MVNEAVTLDEDRLPGARAAMTLSRDQGVCMRSGVFRMVVWGLALGAGLAAPLSAANVTAGISASVVKPLKFSKLRDLNFGTVTLGNLPGARTLSVSQAGLRTCPAPLTCTGVATSALYNVQGTNKMQVNITARPSQLFNTTTPASPSLTFTPSAPASVTLTSSGIPGNDFAVGGSVVIDSTTASGTYSGTIDVTVDYP